MDVFSVDLPPADGSTSLLPVSATERDSGFGTPIKFAPIAILLVAVLALLRRRGRCRRYPW